MGVTKMDRSQCKGFKERVIRGEAKLLKKIINLWSNIKKMILFNLTTAIFSLLHSAFIFYIKV